MKTRFQKSLTDEIGFISKEQLEDYQNLQTITDKISDKVRQLDVTMGGITLAYLAIVGDNKSNDLITESFKAFMCQSKNLLKDLRDDIDKTLKEMNQR